MTDTRTLENHFLGTVQAMVAIAYTTRQFTKALTDLPQSTEASDAMTQALLGGVPKERLRTIAKACQGDSRRGRDMASRISEWIDTRPIAKAIEEPAPAVIDEPAPDTRTAIKALRERYDAEGREVAKAMIHPHTRTVNGKIVQVKGYEVARAAAQIPGEAHQVGLGLNSPWQGKAMKARDASQAACYASHADDHHAAAEAHDKAADAHDRVGHDKSDSIAARHREIAADHRALADTTPALNRDDNMTAPEKEVIHPKTDMVD